MVTYKNFDWRKNCGSGEFFDFQIEFLRFQIEFWDFGEIEFLRKRPKKPPDHAMNSKLLTRTSWASGF